MCFTRQSRSSLDRVASLSPKGGRPHLSPLQISAWWQEQSGKEELTPALWLVAATSTMASTVTQLTQSFKVPVTLEGPWESW